MATERAQDLHAFKSFVDQQLATDPLPTVDEVIARWSNETQPDERAATTRPAVADTEEAVAELREKFGLTTDARTLQSHPEEWIARLQAFVDSHPVPAEPSAMDDSRESIYAGRGE